MGDDVLVEAQLAAGANDTGQLRKRSLLVGHGAEHERGDSRVECPRLASRRSRRTRSPLQRRVRRLDMRTCVRMYVIFDPSQPHVVLETAATLDSIATVLA